MMPAITLEIRNPDGFAAPWRATPRAVELFVGEMAFLLKAKMRQAAPRGVQRIHPKSKRKPRRRALADMMRVIKYEKRGLTSGAIVGTTGIAYARYLVEGTDAHAIIRRRAKVLTIYAPGDPSADEYGYIFRRAVQHPGTAPNDYRKRAIGLVTTRWRQELWASAHKKAHASLERAGALPDIAIREA